MRNPKPWNILDSSAHLPPTVKQECVPNIRCRWTLVLGDREVRLHVRSSKTGAEQYYGLIVPSAVPRSF